MKFEVNMIRYSEAKPIHSIFFYPYSLARNNLMYQSKIIFPPGWNSQAGHESGRAVLPAD